MRDLPQRATPRGVPARRGDTLRPDRLSCYGYDGHATPHIDALAVRGVRFDRAQAVASWTIPSMGAVFTSLYPTQLGLTESPAPPDARYEWRELRDQLNDTLSLEERTLAEIFADAEYHTAAFVDQPGLIAYGNFFQGFAEAYYPSGVRQIERFDPATLEYPKWPPFLRHAFASDEELIGEFERWLPAQRERRLFVWLHLLTPHWPYDPPAAYMPDGEVARSDEDKLEPRFYDGEVRAADALVGRITQAIDTAIGLDRALVVFASDHGEALGEHGMYDHGHSLHAEVVRIPLIFAGPGLPRGRTVQADVRAIDILPTLAQLAGDLPPPPRVQGQSLVPLIEGTDREQQRPQYAEAMLYGDSERSLSAGNFKLMYEAPEPTYRLFDLSADPTETNDVAAHEPEVADRLRGQLEQLYADLAADGAQRATRLPSGPPTDTERVLDALRALGYTGR